MVLLAILFHLGYHDLWPWFKPYIDIVYSLGHPVDLYISYQTKSDLFKSIQSQYSGVTFVECSKGMDIGGQLLMTKAAIESNKPYDYVLKLHTKTAIQWRKELVEPICGSVDQIRGILDILNEYPNIGMVGAAKWKRHIDDRNTVQTNKLCDKFDFKIKEFFIGGTMFWLRWSTMLRIVGSRKINLKDEHDLMEPEKPREPSCTHAWERILGIMISSMDQEIRGVGFEIPIDFDYQWYLNTYPDLTNANIRTYEGAVNHWTEHGRREGRMYNAKMANNNKVPMVTPNLKSTDIQTAELLENQSPISNPNENETSDIQTENLVEIVHTETPSESNTPDIQTEKSDIQTKDSVETQLPISKPNEETTPEIQTVKSVEIGQSETEKSNENETTDFVETQLPISKLNEETTLNVQTVKSVEISQAEIENSDENELTDFVETQLPTSKSNEETTPPDMQTVKLVEIAQSETEQPNEETTPDIQTIELVETQLPTPRLNENETKNIRTVNNVEAEPVLIQVEKSNEEMTADIQTEKLQENTEIDGVQMLLENIQNSALTTGGNFQTDKPENIQNSEMNKNQGKSKLIPELNEFDAEFYLSHYVDLRINGIATKEAALNHWNNHGKTEGRCSNRKYVTDTPRDELSWEWYLKFYTDLPKHGVKTRDGAYQHWYKFGKKEGRFPNEALYNKSKL